MIIKKNDKKVKNKFAGGKITTIECITPNIADRVMTYSDSELKLDELINECTDVKCHTDGIKPCVFIYALLTAKLKRLFSITQSIVALTAPELIKKFEINIFSKKEFTTEGNMRAFIKKLTNTDEITDDEVNAQYEINIAKNKKIADDINKKTTDKKEIKEMLQIKKNGTVFVSFFNKINGIIIDKLNLNHEEGNIHILDCVKIPVTTKNKNYELSSVINYEGEKIRGYKMGVLRLVTPFGGVIEHLVNGTLSDSDISLTEDDISNYSGFKKGDFILADRGFASINFVKKLVNRGLNVIIPVKKNMAGFKEAVDQAKKLNENQWINHPNKKRKGQKIVLIKNLKGTWLDDKEKNKKPAKIQETALDFSACVIRIEKALNPDITKSSEKAEDETDIMYEDEKYIYLVITSTKTSISASEIIRLYEMRPEIEEDFRQLKDIWKMCTFKSVDYVLVMSQITLTFLAYNLFNIYKSTPAGEKYINKSMRKISNEEKTDRYPFKEVSYLIITDNDFCYVEGIELLDLYAKCSPELRDKIRALLGES